MIREVTMRALVVMLCWALLLAGSPRSAWAQQVAVHQAPAMAAPADAKVVGNVAPLYRSLLWLVSPQELPGGYRAVIAVVQLANEPGPVFVPVGWLLSPVWNQIVPASPPTGQPWILGASGAVLESIGYTQQGGQLVLSSLIGMEPFDLQSVVHHAGFAHATGGEFAISYLGTIMQGENGLDELAARVLAVAPTMQRSYIEATSIAGGFDAVFSLEPMITAAIIGAVALIIGAAVPFLVSHAVDVMDCENRAMANYLRCILLSYTSAPECQNPPSVGNPPCCSRRTASCATQYGNDMTYCRGGGRSSQLTPYDFLHLQCK